MRVLIIASFAESLLTFRGALIQEMLDRGIEVHVVSPGLSTASDPRKSLVAKGVVAHDIPFARTGTDPFADLCLVWKLFRLMRQIRPDFVLGYTVKPVIYGSLAGWLARIPRRYAIITGLGYAFQGGGERDVMRGLVRRLYTLTLARVSKVFFQNPDDQALFRQLGMLIPGTPSVVVNGSGVDVDYYSIAELPEAPARFLMIGRLMGDKGVREYAEAARQVRREHPEARFALVGWIDENPDAISQTELDAWIAEGRIEFYGRLADVRPAITGCSVYVLPSYREGTPRTVLEAMAMGRPIITTDAPGCRETVIDGDNGFFVPVRSVDALVAAMLRFIEDPELAPRMGARSREIAEDKYDVHKVNEVMLREMGITDRGVSKVTQHG